MSPDGPVIINEPGKRNPEKDKEKDKQSKKEPGDPKPFDPVCAIGHQKYGNFFKGHLLLSNDGNLKICLWIELRQLLPHPAPACQLGYEAPQGNIKVNAN